METASEKNSSAYLLTLSEWPKLDWGVESVDGLIPSCRLENWRRFEGALGNEIMNPSGSELIFRGHRRHEWQLTPSLGRYSSSQSGVVDEKRALEQKREFRLAMRGRGIGPDLLDEDNELWAYGQHHGLATPLLDWTKSPFVALFFAFADPDLAYEDDNPSRAIFVINKTALEALDDALIVQPMRNDHARLVNQAGLFTLSPTGSETLVTRILNLISETQTVNMDDPEDVGRYIFKIHIPNEERRECLGMLRKMNLHHGSLFPDPIGASWYCNEWYGRRVDDDGNATVKRSSLPVPNSRSSTGVQKPPGETSRTEKPAAKPGLARVLEVAGVDPKQVPILASDLTAKFNATAPTDWTGRGFGNAAVSVEIKRILRMNGVEPENLAQVASAALEFFTAQAINSTTSQEGGDG